MPSDEEKFRARRAFVAEQKARDAVSSPSVMRSAMRPALSGQHSLLRSSSIGDAITIRNEPLNRKTRAAVQRLGLEPSQRSSVLEGASPPPPLTYPPLAGLRQNQRGNTIRVDSTLFGVPIASLPAGSTGYFPSTTIVEARSPGDDADAITVVLGFQFSSPALNSANAFNTQATATLQWGIGGAEFSAEIDFVNGTIVSLPANYLRVIGNVPDNAASAGDGQPLFLLSAGLSYGVALPHRNRARYTVGLSTAAASQTITIPDFAVGMNIVTRDATVGPVKLTQIAAGNNATRAIHQWLNNTQAYDQSVGAFPIANGADFLTIAALTPGDVVSSLDVVFDLAF